MKVNSRSGMQRGAEPVSAIRSATFSDWVALLAELVALVFLGVSAAFPTNFGLEGRSPLPLILLMIVWGTAIYVLICKRFFRTRIYREHLESAPNPWTRRRSSFPLSSIEGVGLVYEAAGSKRWWSRELPMWHLSIWDGRHDRVRILGMTCKGQHGARLIRRWRSDRNDDLARSHPGRTAEQIYQQWLAIPRRTWPAGPASTLTFADEASAGREPWALWTPYSGLQVFTECEAAAKHFHLQSGPPANLLLKDQ
jgi:hypothetical protein